MRAQTILLTLALSLAGASDAVAHTTDNEVRVPVNYFTLVPPPVGQTYIDPAFGTTIRRLSDARHQLNAGDTGYLAFIANEYSTMSPFNQGASLLLLQHQGYFGLYDGEGAYQRDLPFDIAASTEPRWSRHAPNLLYYLYGNSLKSYDVVTGVRTVVRAFPEYAAVSGRGESDICFDGDHLVLVGDLHDIFVYELSTDRKGPALDATGHGFDNVYIAPGDQVIVSWYERGEGPWRGIQLYDRDMGFLRQLAPALSHMDVGRDTDGQPILIRTNAGDPQAPATCQNGLVKIRLVDGASTCLLSLDWSLAVHVSVPDGGDWFFASTYAPGDPAPLPGSWRLHAGEVLQVRLDGSEVRRLAHHRSRPLNDYWYTPRAAVSRDGGRLVYTSNYGLPELLQYPTSYADVYLVDVAASAPAYPGSASAIRTRYEQDHASVSYTGYWPSSAVFFHSGGSAALAMDAGSRGTFHFNGTAVRWIGYRDEWSGIARVFLDGQLQSTVDTYASPYQAQAALFSASELAPGSHALDIEVTGTRNPASGGSWVWLDAFEVAVRTEQDQAAVSYSGAWLENVHSFHSGGSAVLTVDAGARASFRFSGTSVSWIGYRDEWSGIAQVYIDDVLRAEIDTYATPFEAQQVVYTLTGLPPGEHTLAIGVAGRRHPLSLGYWVWVDAFETRPE